MLKRSSLIFSNDLDTLLASWLSSKIKGNRLVYDSHEYYTGVPELENRPLVRGVWKSIERFIFPRLKTVITVNESIAELYKLEYGNNITVIRNVPAGGEKTDFQSYREAVREELNIPSTTRLIILQGSGINKDRGGEELVRAMAHTQNVKLLIIGGGDVLEELKHICKNEKTDDKVLFLPRMPIAQLMRYTAACDLGLTLDKDTNINYRFSLPNKIFDYVRAGVPVLASRLKEVEKIIQQWNIGGFIENHDPKHIGQRIMEFLDDQKSLDSWKKNTQLAASELCWEREVLKFPDLR